MMYNNVIAIGNSDKVGLLDEITGKILITQMFSYGRFSEAFSTEMFSDRYFKELFENSTQHVLDV